jgi:hypothetical protein
MGRLPKLHQVIELDQDALLAFVADAALSGSLVASWANSGFHQNVGSLGLAWVNSGSGSK